jgi:hypothetical protein
MKTATDTCNDFDTDFITEQSRLGAGNHFFSSLAVLQVFGIVFSKLHYSEI